MHEQANATLAKANLTHETTVHELAGEVEVLYSTLRGKKAAYDALVVRQNCVLQRYTPENMLAKMSAAIDEADNASEDVTEAFMAGDKSE